MNVRAPVVADCNAAPVLDATEDIFNLVPLFLERLVIADLDLAVLARRDARGDTAPDQGFADQLLS